MDKPKLGKSSLPLKQFDGTVIKVIAHLKRALEIIVIMVIACDKNHLLLGTDVGKWILQNS